MIVTYTLCAIGALFGSYMLAGALAKAQLIMREEHEIRALKKRMGEGIAAVCERDAAE